MALTPNGAAKRARGAASTREVRLHLRHPIRRQGISRLKRIRERAREGSERLTPEAKAAGIYWGRSLERRFERPLRADLAVARRQILDGRTLSTSTRAAHDGRFTSTPVRRPNPKREILTASFAYCAAPLSLPPPSSRTISSLSLVLKLHNECIGVYIGSSIKFLSTHMIKINRSSPIIEEYQVEIVR
jgi:hypothetical protein